MAESLIYVDKRDRVLGQVDRYVAHSGHGTLHRGFLIVIKNSDNQIYIAQRSAKRPDLKNFPAPFPLQWDGSIAGHPRANRSYINRAVSELEEELGLIVRKSDLQWLGQFYYRVPDPAYSSPDDHGPYKVIETEICGTYLLHTNKEPKPNPVEIAQGQWVAAEKLKSLVDKFDKQHVITEENGTIRIKNFDSKKLMFAPWFVEAQKLYPQIYARS